MILAKQWHGPIGTVELYFDAAMARFSDFAGEGRQAGMV
jgi:replicative DNA helicase